MSDFVNVVSPKVKMISHTPEPEKIVALAAKLCYSNTNPEKIYESLTDEEVAKYLKHLESYGHESPIEHASFTFLITGMTRSALAQFTRHRIASFSVQSQRYINFSDFSVGVPEYIEYPAHENENSEVQIYGQLNMQKNIDHTFKCTMNIIKDSYDLIRDGIIFMEMSKFICANVEEFFDFRDDLTVTDERGNEYKLKRDWYDGYGDKPIVQAVYDTFDPFIAHTSSTERVYMLKQAFFGFDKFRKEYNRVSKIANENARCVLPNATTCNIITTMNARELRHFFTLRCCNRAQKEIRGIAWQMLNLCKEVAPNLFAKSGPSCLYGSCGEGSMTCGHPYTSKESNTKK